MYSNLAFDFGIGLVPIVGDFADAWFKCNTRNNLLLEKFLRERGATNPAPPPPPKQSTVRRWFGTGPSAPGSHPGEQPVPVETAVGPASTVPVGKVADNGVNPNAPVVPVKKEGKPKLSGRGAGTDGGRGVLAARERDLEAQIQSDNAAIHYSRE
jgi:hypothetical protein